MGRDGVGTSGRLSALVCVAVLGILAPSAAAAGTPPQTALEQAQGQVQALVGAADPPAKAALTDAVSQLGSAAASYLWSDPSDALPPPTGDLVFTDAASALGALNKLRHDSSVAAGALASASAEILGACTALAAAALERAGLKGPSGHDAHAAQKEYDRAFHQLGRQISAALDQVPQATIEQSAENFLNSPGRFAFMPTALSGSPLTLQGKPDLLAYMGEFCPFCAVTRWSLALALEQFGHLSPLALSESTPVDLDPSTNTLTFAGVNYNSPVLSFEPLERWSDQQCAFSPGCPYGFTELEKPTPAEGQLLAQNDAPGYLPYLDFGNVWQELWAINPALLQGLSWEQIAAAVGDPSSTLGQSLDGAAELFAAMICQQTGGRPDQVCGTALIRSYQQLLSTPAIAVDAPNAFDGVACPAASLCVAVDSAGNALLTHDANTANPTWSQPTNIDGTNVLDYVRCPSSTLCIAVDEAGNVMQTDDPEDPTPVWSTPENIDGTSLLELSCPSTSLCVASDTAGNVLVTDDPSALRPTWSTPDQIDTTGFGDISCPTTSFCIAVDYAGNAFVTHDASAASPTWSGPTTIDGGSLLDGIGCATSSLCLAVDYTGNLAISHDADAADPTWSTQTNVSPFGFADATCPSTALCLAVDYGGDVLETHNPTAASPTWGPPGKFFAPTP